MTEIDTKLSKEQNATLFVVLVTNFVIPFSITSLNIAVPHIGAEFRITAGHLTWIVLLFSLTTVILTIPFGRLADIRGRENILKVGIFLIGAASLASVFANDLVLFFVFRVLQGVGGAMVFATNVSILVDAIPANRRGGLLGIAVAAVYTGMACGPAIGGIITHNFGWRGVFVLMALLSVIALIAAILRLPKKEINITRKNPNLTSLILFMAAIGLVAYGFTTIMQNFWSYIILAAGIVFTILFVKHELHTDTPVIDIRLLRDNPDFTYSNIAALFNYAATFAIAYLMSIYLQLVKGLDADISGIILISQPILQTIVSPFAGRLSDKRSPYALASFGMALCTASLFMFAFVSETTPLSYIIIALILVGVGFGFFASPNSNIIMSSVSRNDYSMASAVQSTARSLGQVICMAVITIIMNAVIGNQNIEEAPKSDIVLDMNISFAVLAAVCFIGIFFSAKRNHKKML